MRNLNIENKKSLKQDSKYSCSPNKSIKENLNNGFLRFKSGLLKQDHANWEQAKTLYRGQNPYAIIIACSDSRVAPEILFNVGMGELFVIRTAGNVLSDRDLGSIEYAVMYLGVKDIVVLGHTSCGAVSVAQSYVQSKYTAVYSNLFQIIEDIEPVIPVGAEIGSIDDAAIYNVNNMMNRISSKSLILKKCIKKSGLEVHGCFYNLKEGLLEWLNFPTKSSSSV